VYASHLNEVAKHLYRSSLSLSLSLSLSILMAICPGEPWLAGFIAAKDNGSGGDNWSTEQGF